MLKSGIHMMFAGIPRHRRNGGEDMRTLDIALNRPDHASTLVNITNRYPFIIQLRQGRYVVDGKSILGVCSLEHSKPITMEVYSDHCDELLDDLQPLMC